jgi:hypothetical protein
MLVVAVVTLVVGATVVVEAVAVTVAVPLAVAAVAVGGNYITHMPVEAGHV